MPEIKLEIRICYFLWTFDQTIRYFEKWHILTKDTENNVPLYNVLKAKKVEDPEQVEFEQEDKNFLGRVFGSTFMGKHFKAMKNDAMDYNTGLFNCQVD